MSEDPTKIKLQTDVKKGVDPTLVRMRGIVSHTYQPFDVPFMSHVHGNLYHGGIDQSLGLILPKYIKHVISLYPWEQYRIKHDLNSHLQVTMYDSLDQSTEQVDALARWLNTCLLDGPTLVHCQAGLNRSSLVIARAMMMNGRTSQEAIDLLREARSPAVLSNHAFEEYLHNVWYEKGTGR